MPFLNLTIGAPNAIFYNSSSIIATQPPGMTTTNVWLFCISVGLIALFLSRLDINDTGKDLAGVVASLFLLLSAIQSFAVDVMSEPLMISGVNPLLGVVIQTHTIYHYDLIGYILGVLFVISLANLYLLWIDSKRIVNQEQAANDRTSMPQRRAYPPRNQREKDEDGYEEDEE